MKIPEVAIKANMRKEKGHMIIIIILFIVAVFMMMTGTIMIHSFGDVFVKKSKDCNAADLYVVMKENVYDESWKEWLEDSDKVKETEVLDTLYLEGATVEYNSAEMQVDLIVFPKKQNRTLSTYNICEEDGSVKNPVYVGLDFKNNGGYEIGDAISFSYLGKDYTYHIAGFVEDIYNGFVRNQMNTGILLPEKEYSRLEDEFSGNAATTVKGIVLQAALKNHEDSEKVLNEFLEYASFSGEAEYGIISYTEVKDYFDQKISMVASILIAFAIILTFVVMLVIYFEIVDYYQNNIKNVGIMKAVGYTSGQLIQIQVWQFGVVALTACVIGAVFCAVIYPSLAALVVSSTWLVYEVQFSVLELVVVPVVLIIVTIIVTLLTNIRVKKMYPVEALGLSAGNGKKVRKNRFDLRKHKGSLNVLLAFKTFFRNLGLNSFVLMIVILVTFVMGFILTLNYNIGYKPENIINMLMYEYPDVQFLMNPYEYDENIMEELEDNEDVKQAIFFDIKTVKCEQDTVYAYVTKDFSVTRNNIVYDGRHPENAKEIAIGGKLAQHFDKHIGDTITIKNGDKECEYEITGLIQTSVGYGFDCELVSEAYEKICDDYVPYTGYVYMNDKKDAESFVKTLKNDYSDKVFSVTNQIEMIDESMSTYINLINVITEMFSVLTMFIIIIIMNITIRKVVFRQRKSFGIQKAVGFVSSDLIKEMLISFLPVVIAGALVGTLCAIGLSNPLCTAIFSIMGIVKVNFTIYIPWLITMGVLTAVFSCIAMLVFLRKIKKMSAYQILLEGK